MFEFLFGFVIGFFVCLAIFVGYALKKFSQVKQKVANVLFPPIKEEPLEL